MNPDALGPRPVRYKDRMAWLVVFGLFTVFIGVVCGMFVPLSFLGASMNARAGLPTDYRMIVTGAAFYAVLSVALIWLGIGSILARRWARALMLVFAWSWLILGVMMLTGFVLMVLQFDAVIAAAAPPGQPPLPPEFKAILLAVIGLFETAIFVVLPLIWVLFYRSKSVEATIAARNPRPSWTDRCPLQVLGISIWLGIGALMMAAMPLTYRGVVPFFGTFLTGFAGSALYLALAAAWGYAAWAFYRREPLGWWVLLVTVCVTSVSGFVTFLNQDFIEMYELMGYPPEQVEQMRKLEFLGGQEMAWLTLAFSWPFVVYLIYARKFFRRPPGGNDTGQPV